MSGTGFRHVHIVGLSVCVLFPASLSLLSSLSLSLPRYHLYVDCMPTARMPEIDRDILQRMLDVARSTSKLKEPRSHMSVSESVN